MLSIRHALIAFLPLLATLVQAGPVRLSEQKSIKRQSCGNKGTGSGNTTLLAGSETSDRNSTGTGYGQHGHSHGHGGNGSFGVNGSHLHVNATSPSGENQTSVILPSTTEDIYPTETETADATGTVTESSGGYSTSAPVVSTITSQPVVVSTTTSATTPTTSSAGQAGSSGDEATLIKLHNDFRAEYGESWPRHHTRRGILARVDH